jgi:hypothetical protein
MAAISVAVVRLANGPIFGDPHRLDIEAFGWHQPEHLFNHPEQRGRDIIVNGGRYVVARNTDDVQVAEP